ncbi:hypothetical protein [Halostella salina]|uniref:hypothetical protein n=1 Tax=Halostella salina TaxID=1547897 RepID=UPI000EF76BD1|nr:hypothetical protein [Halostella salina]
MSTTPPTTPSTSPASRPDRDSAPLGIKIICVIGFLGALFALLAAFRLLGVGGAAGSLGLVFLFLSLGQFVVYAGLWTLAGWAWKWALILEGLGIVLDLYELNAVGLLVGLVVFGYVFSKGDLYE